MRSSLALASISIALFTPAVASATASFPNAMKSHLSLSYTPPCTVCHTTDSGGSGTVTKDFGKAMRQNGLQSGNTDSLNSALDALTSGKVDSDCDGVLDPAQLQEGRDPNTGEFIDGSGQPKPESDAGACGSGTGGSGSSNTETSDPAYGCGAQLAQGRAEQSAWAVVAALGTMLGLGLSRRRSPRRS